MYWLCFDDGGPALIIYAAEAPDRYDHEYGYDTREEAEATLGEAQP
jgi:hypothetical protein